MEPRNPKPRQLRITNASGIGDAVLTVAVTGHRGWEGLPPVAIARILDNLLVSVETALDQGLQSNDLDRQRSARFRCVSALAAGADQIATKAALSRVSRHRWEVQAILPFGRDAYAQTMTGESEQGARQWLTSHEAGAIPTLELADWDWQPGQGDPHSVDREWERRRFLTVGQILVQQADLLVAVWRGDSARGMGGTADVVAEAWRAGVPVIWIDPANGDTHSMVPDLTHRHMPALEVASRLRYAARPEGNDAPNAGPAIQHAVASVLLGRREDRRNAVLNYGGSLEPASFKVRRKLAKGGAATETLPGTTAFLYNACLRAIVPAHLRPAGSGRAMAMPLPRGRIGRVMRWRPFVQVFRTRWDDAIGRHAATQEPTLQEATAIDKSLQAEADRADTIASESGNIYRSGYFTIFLAAAAAVAFALGFLLHEGFKPISVILEIATIAFAFFILLRNSAVGIPILGVSGKDCHRIFLESRMISESLHASRLAAWTAMAGRRVVEQEAGDDVGESRSDDAGTRHHPKRLLWTPHYINAVMALPGLPTGTMSPERIGAIACATSTLLAGQLQYHRKNAARLEALHEGLDRFSIAFIVVGVAVAMIYLVLFGLKRAMGWSEHDAGYHAYHLWTGVAAFLGGVLPALAAALTGIRYHGDFERFASRSKDTARQLQAVASELDAVAAENAHPTARPKGLGSPPFERLRAVITQAQRVLEEDITDWRFAYAVRPMPAP